MAPRTLHDLSEQLHGRIVHRSDVLRSGYTNGQLRALVAAGGAEVLRRSWFASPSAPPDLREAALRGGRITCVTLARYRGWWMPEGVDDRPHLHFVPGSTGPRSPWPGVAHWTRPLVPGERTLVGSIEDALAHIALCLPRDTALVLWEAAARAEGLAPEALRAIPWTSNAAAELAQETTGLADSGLEVLVVRPLRRMGVRVRQQVWIAGKPVDVLVGERLVLQIDGWEHHSSSAQRAKDIAHDAELRLRGYTVFRFSYAQIVHQWAQVERLVQRAIAAGCHLAA
ncbi:endonuclease domain-containing protein [Microbacterium sp.]|uniref:endonuclease domain-containing protein n=1 Tax=Microbacterium sp. TaxID=51671 RepID=UPI0039E64E78